MLPKSLDRKRELLRNLNCGRTIQRTWRFPSAFLDRDKADLHVTTRCRRASIDCFLRLDSRRCAAPIIRSCRFQFTAASFEYPFACDKSCSNGRGFLAKLGDNDIQTFHNLRQGALAQVV
jgi:hypothetical protein